MKAGVPIPEATKPTADEIDAQRLRQTVAGDRSSFDALYIDYHRRLTRFLMRFTRQHATVEEIINDTMYAVWNQADSFRGGSKVSTWILGIAMRQANNTLRSLQRARRHDREAAEVARLNEDAPGMERHLAHDQWLDRALDELPMAQRQVIELAYFMGCSGKEIATIVGCPENTVKSRLFSARQHLQHALRRLDEEAPDGP